MTAKPRLWVFSELYYPEETSTGYFLTRIAEGLTDRFEVNVVCSPPTYSERGVKVAVRETRHGTTIHRTRSTRFDKDRTPGRIANLASFTLLAAWHALRRVKRGDRILVVTNPPTLPPLIGLIARLKRARAALLVHDVYPEVLVATGHVRAGGVVARAVGRVMQWTCALFDDVVVLGRDMRALYAAKIDAARTKLHIIPNWGDIDEVRPIARADNSFAAENGLIGKTVIQLSGNLGRTHAIELVLDAAAALAHRRDIVFLFVGYGGKARLVGKTAESAANIVMLPRQPRTRLGEMLACADATVIPFVDEMYGVSVPSRMYNVMAAGVPIIAVADPRSELALVVAETGSGWVLPSDASALAQLAEDIADGRADAAGRGRAGRQQVEACYTLPVVLDAFADMFA